MTEEPADHALMTFVSSRERLIAVACRVVERRAVAEELVQDSWLQWHARIHPAKKALPILRSLPIWRGTGPAAGRDGNSSVGDLLTFGVIIQARCKQLSAGTCFMRSARKANRLQAKCLRIANLGEIYGSCKPVLAMERLEPCALRTKSIR